MPEGPEVWILSGAVCKYYGSNTCYSIGKHLIDVEGTIWSFGLNGSVAIDENNKMYKPNDNNWIYGQNKKYNYENDIYTELNCPYVDWMDSSPTIIQNFVKKISKSKSKLGPLIIKQQQICGIGVAWGSEILHRANLNPNIPARHQDLTNLAKVMIEVREEIKQIYMRELETCSDVKEFILRWFENLYEIRPMQIYKIGKSVEIGGRKWWVANE